MWWWLFSLICPFLPSITRYLGIIHKFLIRKPLWPSWILNSTPRAVSSEIWQIITAGKTSRNIVLSLLMLILLCQSSIPGKLVQMETGMCAYFEQHSFIFIVAKCQGFFAEDLKLFPLVEPFFQNSTECLTWYIQYYAAITTAICVEVLKLKMKKWGRPKQE